ncbi:MAG: (2Fe-2S)-binding protein [Kordiimonadaceae bacterium]|jgi:isoquinoline 1-oxidoreductase subunit alpha|nr:(2Fe-2S)-binding protein [Kordiimonadaceae bacterium]MBT6032138.1 (2Fe-2S)-binding protein [Kordiimonadaceae bacterium]
MITLNVNGKSLSYDGDEDMPLLWFLRENAELTGTKYGCGIGQCGACTVHIDGEAERSCTIPMAEVGGTNISTIENLSANGGLHFVQRVWIEEDVPQCGYCQSGQIMATITFLEKFPNPTDEDIDKYHTNICRCGSYDNMRKAIHKAAKLQAEGATS